MRKLDSKRFFYLKEILKSKNGWAVVPPTVIKLLESNLDKITFLSNNPDRINNKIRNCFYCEYSSIEDLEKDLSIFEEWGMVNVRPGNIRKEDPKGVKISRRNEQLRLSFMPLEDPSNMDWEIKCLQEAVKEEDFMKDMMGGKLPF